MFKNIGKKIKAMATVFTWLGIIAFSLSGLVIIFTVVFRLAQHGHFTPEMLLMLLAGIAVIGVGIFISWIGSFMLYAYGEIADSTEETKKLLQFQNDLMVRIANSPAIKGEFPGNAASNAPVYPQSVQGMGYVQTPPVSVPPAYVPPVPNVSYVPPVTEPSAYTPPVQEVPSFHSNVTEAPAYTEPAPVPSAFDASLPAKKSAYDNNIYVKDPEKLTKQNDSALEEPKFPTPSVPETDTQERIVPDEAVTSENNNTQDSTIH